MRAVALLYFIKGRICFNQDPCKKFARKKSLTKNLFQRTFKCIRSFRNTTEAVSDILKFKLKCAGLVPGWGGGGSQGTWDGAAASSPPARSSHYLISGSVFYNESPLLCVVIDMHCRHTTHPAARIGIRRTSPGHRLIAEGTAGIRQLSYPMLHYFC